jgi:hypothetical protein
MSVLRALLRLCKGIGIAVEGVLMSASVLPYPECPARPPAPGPVVVAPSPIGHLRRAEARQFATMEHAYARRGGLVGGDEAAWLLRRHAGHPISVLARWIVERRVVSFTWESRLLVPMFQFTPCEMSLRAGVSEAARALSGRFDDWTIALWFARPNEWLGERAPLDVVELDPVAVTQAALAEGSI